MHGCTARLLNEALAIAGGIRFLNSPPLNAKIIQTNMTRAQFVYGKMAETCAEIAVQMSMAAAGGIDPTKDDICARSAVRFNAMLKLISPNGEENLWAQVPYAEKEELVAEIRKEVLTELRKAQKDGLVDAPL